MRKYYTQKNVFVLFCGKRRHLLKQVLSWFKDGSPLTDPQPLEPSPKWLLQYHWFTDGSPLTDPQPLKPSPKWLLQYHWFRDGSLLTDPQPLTNHIPNG